MAPGSGGWPFSDSDLADPSPALYPAPEILHILGFVVLVGSIVALDLRLLGLGRAIAIQPMAQLLLPLSRLGFLLAITMGFLPRTWCAIPRSRPSCC